MRKAKVAAISMGIIASLLFGGYAVADAATVTLDESAAGTPDAPQPISASKAQTAAQSPSASDHIILKETVESYEDYTPLYVPVKTEIELVQPETEPTEEEFQAQKQTVAHTDFQHEEPVVQESTEPQEQTPLYVPEESEPVENENNENTEEFSEPVENSTEIETQEETKQYVPLDSPEPETTEETTSRIFVKSIAVNRSTETSAPETTEPEEETSAETIYTVADITTAAHKETTTKATTKATTPETTKVTTKATTKATTTTTKETTTTTTTTTTTETTTETTTTEPIITTTETTVPPEVINPEVVEVPEVYLDDMLDVDYVEVETAPEVEEFSEEVFEENIEEVEEFPADDPENPEIISVTSVNDSDYVLLCNCVAHEAGSENISIENKARVVEVIMNRVASSNFPNTVYGVITQPYQFSGSSSYANYSGYTSKVTQNVISAVDLYFADPSAFNEGYLYFYGDGSQNHFTN